MVIEFVRSFLGLEMIYISDDNAPGLEDASHFLGEAWRGHHHKRVLRANGDQAGLQNEHAREIRGRCEERYVCFARHGKTKTESVEVREIYRRDDAIDGTILYAD